MKKYWNRLLAGGMALAMALTLLPVQTLAQELWGPPEAEPQVDAATRSITLPVLTQDGEIPLSEEEEETGPITYVYETEDSFSLETGRQGNRLYVLDDTGAKLETDLNDSYTLILRDAKGNEAARKDGVSCYRDGEWVDSKYVKTYCYVGSAYFRNVTLDTGTYSIELVAGNTTYPCLGRVEVVSSNKLMLSDARLRDFRVGVSEFEVRLSLYGLEKEEELNNFSLILTDANGNEVAKNSGYRLEDSYSGKWIFYARMTVQEGKAIAASEEYSLTITYSSDAAKELVNAVSAITQSADAAKAQLAGFEILDPQTAKVQVDLKDTEAGKTYRVTVRNGNSDRSAVVGAWEGEFAAAGANSVTLTLLLSDASASQSITVFESQFYVTLSVMVAEEDYKYEQWQDSESYDNPYANLHENSAAYLTPYYLKVKPTNNQVDFKMYLYNLNLWKGKDDVLTLVSAAEQEVARCDEIVSSSDGNTLLLSGTLKITGTLTAGESYYVRLNGTDVDDVYVVDSIRTMDSMPFSEYRNGMETFWTNLGAFPVTVDVINAKGNTAVLQFRDEAETVLLESETLTATTSTYYDFQRFQYTFPAEKILQFTDGGNYQLVMLIDGETRILSGGGKNEFRYSGTHTAFTPAATRYYNISWYEAKVGDQTVEGWVTLGDRNGLKNIAREELDLLKDLVISTTEESWKVEKIELGELEYSCDLTLTLDKPLTAGEYSVLYNGESIDSFTITAAAESGTPRIYSYYNGKINGVWLPEAGKYTASIYQGYTMMKPAFDLTLQGKCDGENQTLVLPKSAISDLPEGSYDIRVYLNGKLLGSDSFSVAAPTKPVVTLKDGDWVKTAVLSESYAYLEILNSGSYRYVRTAESKDALETANFRHFTAGQSVNISIPTEPVGARTLYVEFSQNGQSGGENIIYELPYWYWADNDYGLQVSEDLQGVQTSPCTLEATLAIPAARVWATATDKNGNTATAELAYAGETGSRYRFALTIEDNDYFGKYNRIRTEDIQSVKFYATDYDNRNCEVDSDARGNLHSDVVERVLLFGDPDSILFLTNGKGAILTNQTSYTLRGVGPVDCEYKVTLGSQGDSVATVQTDAHGLFTLTLDLSDWEENWYYLYFSSSDSYTTGGINLKVDRTAPKIENEAFAIVNGTAALKWSCADTDVERFEIYKGDAKVAASTVYPKSDGSYSVNVSFRVGEADTTFTIKAYDAAGNESSVSVSTADNVKPSAPTNLTAPETTDSTITLSWTAAIDNMGVKGYNITWGEDTGLFVTDTTATITGLTQGTEYTIQVSAEDVAGNLSAEPATVTASTLALTLTPTLENPLMVDKYHDGMKAPVSFTVTANTAEDDDFTPTLLSAEMYYQKADSADKIDEAAWTEVLLTASGNTASGEWNISGEINGYRPMGSYQVYFKAEYAEGLYLESDPQTVTLERDKEAPTAPTNIKGTKNTTTTITLTWTAATDNVAVTEYVIYRDGEKVGTSTTCEFVDTGLKSGQTYTYTIKAKDAAENLSKASAAVELKTLELKFASVMEFAESYVMEEQKDAAIAVSAEFQPIEGYEPEIMVHLQYQRLDENGAGEGWRSVELNAGEDNTFTGSWSMKTDDGEYLPEGTYQARFSVTDGKATVYSDTQPVELQRDKTPPEILYFGNDAKRDTFGGTTPLNVRVSAQDKVVVEKVVYSYAPEGSEDFTDVTTLRFERPGTTFGMSYDWYATEDGTANGTKLRSGTYILKATAYDARDNKSEATLTVTVDNDPPTTPGSFEVTGTSRYIHLMWDQLSDIDRADFQTFRVYRSESGAGEFAKVKELNTIGYFDDANGGIEAGKTYDYYVTAVDTLGNESPPTETLSATYVKDTESPKIGGIWPKDNAVLIKNPLLRVRATDNYRLAKADFSYSLDGGNNWTPIGSVDAKVDKDNTLNNQTFNLVWTEMPEVTEETTCQIRALVYDASINETQGEGETIYAHNDPAEAISTVTLKPYSAPVAPKLEGKAGYLTATLSWTYGGDTDLLRDFTVYKVEGNTRTYVTSVTDTRRSCAVTLPAEGETTFVVVAADVFGEKAESDPVTLASVGGDTEAPKAVIQPETLRAAKGVEFTFSGAGSTDNVGIVSYTWDFGDETAEGTGERVTHTYAKAGTYTVTLTVTDEAGNTANATATMTVYDISGNSEYALLTVTAVNAYEEGTPPIKGAEIRIYSSNPTAKESDLGSAFTDENGKASIVVPVGVQSLTAAADGFLPVSRSFTVRPDENGRDSYDLGMTPMGVSMVDGKLTAEEMTLEEIVEAGIDPSDPANQHVWKFRTELQFYATPSLKFDLPVTGYYNGNCDIVGRAGNGWGWNNFTISGGAGGGTSNQMRVGVFPISEYCILVVYGEAHWLKEMYHVELLVTNNSYTDAIINCNAALELPDGLSLVGGSSRTLNIPYINKKDDPAGSNSASFDWYVRGDKAGDYNLTATVTGQNPDPFLKTFTMDEPIKVYAGNALHLTITAGDIAFQGEEYHVQFKLTNVSDKTLYNLSFGLTGANQFRMVTVGDKTQPINLTNENFEDGMTAPIPAMKPGDSVTIDFFTKAWFNSLAELAEMGPLDVGYLLTGVFLTTLEGSSTTIPYTVNIEKASHGSFYEWALDRAEDGAVDLVADWLDKGLPIPMVKAGVKIYKFAAKTIDRKSMTSTIVITVDENGSFRSNEVCPQSLEDGTSVVEIYTDADPANCVISEDGRTMTITGDATIYVKGSEAGESTVTFKTYAEVPDTVNGGSKLRTCGAALTYKVAGEPGEAKRIVLNPPAVTTVAVPLEGETASVTFPYAVLDEKGNYLAADGLTWRVTDENGKDAEGVSMMNGVLTVWPDAKAGTYTVTATLGKLEASQTIKLTKEDPTATRICVLRNDAELTTDTLMIPVSDVSVYTYYKAKLLDQYGEVMKDLTLDTSELPQNVTFNAQDGKLTLSKDSKPGTVTLTASDGDLTAAVTITITNLAVDWSGVKSAIESTTYTYGDANGKAALPAGGTAQAAGATVHGTFAYEEPNTIQNAGDGTITVTFTVTDEGAYHGVTLTETFPITIAKKALADGMITITGEYTYTGSAITPAYTVADGTLLTANDYAVTVTDNTNAGTATVTVTAAADGNYTSSASKTFTIAKAAINGFKTTAPSRTLLANDEANHSLAELKTAANLPGEVEVTFGESGTANLPITWADSQDTFAPKGGTYHYVGTVVAGENFQPCEKTLTATVTVTPVTGTVAWTTTAITLAKTQVEAAKSLSDLGLPAEITVTYDNEVGEATYPLTDANYTVTLAYLQSLSVERGDRTVEIAVTGEPFPAWATIDTGTLRAALTITEKFLVTVTVTPPAGITYGDTLGAPSAIQTALSHGTDGNATYRYQYKLADAPDTAWTETAPTQAGSYLVRATLVSDTHSGSGTAAFTIAGKALTADMITVTGDYTYTGSAIEPTYTVADGALMTAADYTVTVTNNINAGKGTITVTAAEGGNYSGTVSKTFTIQARSLADSGVTVAPLAEETYRGSALTPIPAVSFGGRRLALETDFTVTYEGNVNAGTAKAIINGRGNFTGSREVTFTIRPAALSGTLTLQGGAAVGSTLTADLSVVSEGAYQWYRDGEAIQDATDDSYTITADDGNAVLTVRFTASGNYTGTLESAAVKVGKQLLTGEVTLTPDTTAEVGTELTLSGTVNDELITAESEHYQIQWLRDGIAIPGANGLTYTAAPADRGHTLTAALTATGETYTGSLTSGGVSVNTEAPTLRLTATAGNGQVTLSWTAENGGGHITHFLLTGPDGITLTLAAEENSYTYTGLTNGTAYTFELTVQTAEGKSVTDTVSATPKAASGGISGGGSGGQEDPGTTVTNPDGSVTTTVVDEATGSVTETTRYPDGGVTTVTTGTDGTVETEIRRADGVKVTAKETADGSLDFQAELPKSVSSARVKVPASLGKDPGQVTVTLTDASGKTWTETVRYRNGSLILTLDASVTGVLSTDFQPVQRFRDVPFGSYCTDAVDWAAELGITTGTTPETFSPAASCTRAQMTVFLWRAMGCPDADGTLLPDVDANAYYAKAVLWAQTMGITKGTANGTFDPNGTVNRAQMVTFLWRLAGEPAGKGTLPFADVDADAYYAEAVRWAVAQGITKGTTASTFAPNEPCNRGQIVTFLYRYLEH